MNKETKDGVENLEQTTTADGLAEENTEKEGAFENVQSEEIRYDNADCIYE